MAEAAHLTDKLRTSASKKTNTNQPLDHNHSSHASKYKPATINSALARPQPVSCSLLEALTHAVSHGVPSPPPGPPPSAEFQAGLERVIRLLHIKVPHVAPSSSPSTRIKFTGSDLTNDVAISIPNLKMASRLPALSTSNLPTASPQEQITTASPARGHAMLNSIFKSVRVPEFRFKWLFWAEKGQQNAPKDKTAQGELYASRPKPLGDQIVSVKEFYQHFNNIPVENLKLRDSIHLFHLGVKPVWEDPRNVRGGAWYFKIGKDVAGQFWHEICLLAVGDVLQGAVETKRASFNDDICGITYSVRWNAVQIAVWNRDAENEAGKEKLLATILEKLSPELLPKKEGSYWYKAHREHAGFIEPAQQT